MPFENHNDIFICTSCFKQTTRRELQLRNFYNGYCGYCGMNLVPLENLRQAEEHIYEAQKRYKKLTGKYLK